jgi:toxin ParE1/3/4
VEKCYDFVEKEDAARRDDIRPGLRVVGFERTATIAFSIEGNRVRIARIFYRGRDYSSLLKNETGRD